MTASDSATFEIGDTEIHRLGFGAMSLAGPENMGWPVDVESAENVLRRALELGVDFVDTADMYGNGSSELVVGEAIKPDRDDVFIATKGGIMKQPDTGTVYNGDPAYLKNAALRSRVRLRVETIDLYQFHRPDPNTPFEDSVTALGELKDKGIIRHVGLSNVDIEHINRAREIVEIETVQNHFNVSERQSQDVLEYCEANGIGFIPYSPLNKATLDDRGDVLDELAETHDASRYQVALAWLLHRSPVILPIPGTSSHSHLEENVAATDIELTDEELRRLE